MAQSPKSEQNDAKRAADGKFLPGHKPPRSPGRPQGPNGIKARASRLAGEQLEAMLGKATDAIGAALDKGDTQVATWLVDRVRPPRQADYFRADIRSELASPEDIVEAARQAVLAVGRGEISLAEAKSYTELLLRLGGIQGFVELETLRAKFDELKAPQSRPAGTFDQGRIPPENRLSWGRGADPINWKS